MDICTKLAYNASMEEQGSHRQYRCPDKPGTVAIAGKAGDDLPPGTWSGIMKQAKLKKK